MAKRGHTSDGKTYCSDCSSGIDAGAQSCEHCGETLTDDFTAAICPYCTIIVPIHSAICTNCGLKLQSEREPRSKEDDEFLSKLLEWGKNLESKRVHEDKLETEKATTTFKDILGAMAPTPMQEESLKEIKKSAEERAEFEKREESILKIAEPLKKALDLRKMSLDGLESRFRDLQLELNNLSPEDLDSEKKRAEIERQLGEIVSERTTIQALEDNINNMDSAYRQLLKQHSVEIKQKEENLTTRLTAFKKEMERREKEKERLKLREDFLAKKEKELQDRINFFKEREESLKRTEDAMKAELAELKAEKEGISELNEPAASMIIATGKWVIDGEEIANIMKKSKKVRDDWFEEQKKIQDGIAKGEAPDTLVKESQERLDGRERELQARIDVLEKELAEAVSEEKDLRKEEKSAAMDIKRLKKVLKVLDDLLEHLPDDIVEKFAKSKDYKEYDELMQELEL